MKPFTTIMLCFSTMTYSVLAQNGDSISENNCPLPLRARIHGHYDESQNCLNECCLSCPFANNFYKENLIEKTYQVFAVLGIISFFLMIILAVFFLVLPSQKQNPLTKQILLPLALSVMYFEGSEFFTLNQRKTQCFDSITPADPKNNKYCAVQAFFTLGGGYAIACCSALLMTHLHLISVWRVEFITRNITYFHILIIGASLSAAIVPFITQNIRSTNLCFISLEASPTYFYFLFFIYIAVIAHLTTFIYMVHVTIKSNRYKYSVTTSVISNRTSVIEAQRQLIHITTIFKMQWRALLGALLMLLIYVLNWQFYVFELQRLDSSVLSTSWIVDWINCLKEHKGQNFCASQISNHIPRYGYIFTLLFFNRTAGILIFIIFAAKKSIWLEVFNFRNRNKNQSIEPESGIRASVRRLSMCNFRNRSVAESAEDILPSSRKKDLTSISCRASVRFSDPPTSDISLTPVVSIPSLVYNPSEEERSNYVMF